MSLRSIIDKLVFGARHSSESYISHLRAKGARIGKGTMLFGSSKILIDETRAWLIEIGENVQITKGVTILTHGYDWYVLKGVYGEILGSSGKVKIGNNVFIGMDSTILKGVTIGDNTIIGAGSVVTRDIPENCVAVGNPAKPVMTLEEYYEKRVKAQYEEAAELVREYREVYGKEPDDKALDEYFWLFCNDEEKLTELWKHKMTLGGNADYSYEVFRNHKPRFSSLEEFLKSVK